MRELVRLAQATPQKCRRSRMYADALVSEINRL